MKAKSLVPCILLSILVILLLSTEAQATEYREVNATDILKQIEDCKEVNLTDCRIVGELDVSTIKLENIPNPHYYKLLNEGYDKETLISDGTYENLSVIESNITIINSIFENGILFSNVLFNSSVDFRMANFNSSADFSYANFNSSADFSYAKFNRSADFSYAKFNRSADFSVANFNSSVDFSVANFNRSAYFFHTKFNRSAYFFHTKFNRFADFRGPQISENVITDGKTCKLFRSYYKNNAQYEEADNLYYNFRKYSQGEKSLTSFPKWIDILSWVTCGYGLRLSHTLYCVLFLVMIFTYIYK